jgi:RHS repeat-associated protein
MGNRTQMIDHYGQITTYQYDLLSREIASKDPLGNTENKKYDVNNHIIELTDKDGYTTKTINNIYGSPLEIQYPDGTSKRFQYNLQGHLIKEWERDGTYTIYHVDYLGRSKRTEKYSKDGTHLKTLQYVYKGKNLISEIDGMGHQTQYNYDGAGRLISKIKGEESTSYEYDSLGRVYKTIRGEEATIQKYDYLDRVIEETIEDLKGNIFSKECFAYDIHGNKSLQRIYNNDQTYSDFETIYNSHNLPSKIIDPLGYETLITYSFTDHLEKVTLDPLGRSKYEIFDSLERVKECKAFSQDGDLLAATYFEYDGRGNIIQQKEDIISGGDSLGNYKIYSHYDSMGQKILENEQDLKLTHFSYQNGRLKTIVNPDGVTLEHHYDGLGRLQELISSDGTVHHRYIYDVNDNVVRAEDLVNQTITERAYDIQDRLIYEKQPSGFEIYYTYDPLNNLKEVNFDNNRVVYSYSPKNLVSVSRYQNGQLKYTYSQKCDWTGKPILKTYSNNQTISFTWDKVGRCSTISSVPFSQSFSYDAVGNLVATSVTDPIGNYDVLFTYDDLNQMKSETGPFSNDYVNDSLFNRRAKNDLPCQVNSLNQIVDDAIDTFAYDINGRRVQKNNAQYTYDALGRLSTYCDGINNIVYQYDPFGRLIKKNDQVYRYQFDLEIGTQNEFRLVHGKGSTFAVELDGMSYFPIRNHRGDICVLLDRQGNAISTYRYDAFGAYLSEETVASPWLFSSQRFDSITGLYHYDKREYDPVLGRWLTPDPLGFADGPNLYAYVQNNPMIFVDPYGLWRETLGNMWNTVRTKTHEFCSSFGRGAIDDTTWGGSNLALGHYECRNWTQTAGYYTGTAASMAVGCLYGGTELKIAGKLAKKTGKFASPYIKGAFTSFRGGAKTGKGLNETSKVVKLTQESSSVIQKTTQAASNNLGVYSQLGTQKNIIPIWSNTSSKTSIENAFMHWNKHKSEFPELKNSKQYVEMAKNMFNNPNSLSKTRINGDIIHYHKETNTFSVYTKDGIPKTMFKPDPKKHPYKSNLEYFHEQ